MFKGAHMVQAVGKFYQDDTDVIDHRQHHFAQILGLLFLACGEVNLADFSDAFDDVGDLFAKLFANVNDRDRRVFDRVVEQSGGDGHRIHFHFGQDLRNAEGVDKVGLAGSPGLTGMIFLGELVGSADQLKIVAGPVGTHGAQQLPELCHREGGGRDLFAQGRHDGL